MAIYHFSAKVVSRKAGQSTVATAAYNAREKLTDERTGEVKDYRAKDGLIFSGIYAPKDAPDWAHDREQLWNHAEAAEKRKDSTLARNYEISLPHELTDEQRRYAIQDFIKENFTRKGYAADLSIHAPDKDGDHRNYHAHILVTDRRIEADGFAADKSERKQKSPERKAALENLRESWEKTGNRHLERHGFEPTLDRRSLAEQGIDREPTMHKGADVTAMERNGKDTDRGEQARQVEARNEALRNLKIEAAKIDHEIKAEQERRHQEPLTVTRDGKNHLTMNADDKQQNSPPPNTNEQEQDQQKRDRAAYERAAAYSRGGMVSQMTDALREHQARQKILDEQNAQLRPEYPPDRMRREEQERQQNGTPTSNDNSAKNPDKERQNAGTNNKEFAANGEEITKASLEQNAEKIRAAAQTEKLKAVQEKGAIREAEPVKNAEQKQSKEAHTHDHESRQSQNKDQGKRQDADHGDHAKKAVDYAALYGKILPSGKELTEAQRERFERAANNIAAHRERGGDDREQGGGIRDRTRER